MKLVNVFLIVCLLSQQVFARNPVCRPATVRSHAVAAQKVVVQKVVPNEQVAVQAAVVPYQQLAPYAAQGQSLTIVNNYPGAIPGAVTPQGATVLGYSSQYSPHGNPFAVDPAEYLRMAQQLANDANKTTQSAIAAFSKSGDAILQAQANIASTHAKGAAAERVLRAAGLSGAGAVASSGPQTTIMTIQQTPGQPPQVKVLTPEQYAAQQGASVAVQPSPKGSKPSTLSAQVPASLLSLKCAKCHSPGGKADAVGLDLTKPIDCDTMKKAIAAVENGRMPPKSEGALTELEIGELKLDLLDILE